MGEFPGLFEPMPFCSGQGEGGIMLRLKYNLFIVREKMDKMNASFLVLALRQKKKKCLVSGNPTDPTFLGPTPNFFETFEIFFCIFRVF